MERYLQYSFLLVRKLFLFIFEKKLMMPSVEELMNKKVFGIYRKNYSKPLNYCNMKRIIILLVTVIFTGSIFAQNAIEPKVRANEFGFHAGATTGVGLSYRYWPGKSGIQITALPIKTSEVTYINFGITALRTFHDSRLIRFFGYLGSNVVVNNGQNYDYWYDPYTDNFEETEDTGYKTRLNFGVGPGFAFGSRVRVNIMAGYGFYDVLGEFNIYPTAEIGLYFRL